MPEGRPTKPRYRKVAFVLKGYPRLSETFITREILALERLGLNIALYALRHPTDMSVHEFHQQVVAPVSYLPEYLKDEPVRVMAGLHWALKQGELRSAFKTFFKDLRRDLTTNRIRRFGQALVLAAELPDDVDHIHAHFLHTPTSVARYAALLKGMDFSFSAHAKDVWTLPEWEIREKQAAAQFGVTCNKAAAAYFQEIVGTADGPPPVELQYHGIDVASLPSQMLKRPDRKGDTAEDPITILTVARTVRKKGLEHLLDSLSALPADLHWRWVHIGGGPDRSALKHKARRAGISTRIMWLGPRTQSTIFRWMELADLFVLPSIIAEGGDRDGLPNALLEAQGHGLACIASDVSGIPEAIQHNQTGILVPPTDTEALTRALVILCRNPKTRAQLGQAAYTFVRQNFSQDQHIGQLAAKFGIEATEELAKTAAA